MRSLWNDRLGGSYPSGIRKSCERGCGLFRVMIWARCLCVILPFGCGSFRTDAQRLAWWRRSSHPSLSVDDGTSRPRSVASKRSIIGSECLNSKPEKNLDASAAPPSSFSMVVRSEALTSPRLTNPLTRELSNPESGRRFVLRQADFTLPLSVSAFSDVAHFCSRELPFGVRSRSHSQLRG